MNRGVSQEIIEQKLIQLIFATQPLLPPPPHTYTDTKQERGGTLHEPSSKAVPVQRLIHS